MKIEIVLNKTCSCGRYHATSTDYKMASVEEYGLMAGCYANCSCGSTMFVPTSKLKGQNEKS